MTLVAQSRMRLGLPPVGAPGEIIRSNGSNWVSEPFVEGDVAAEAAARAAADAAEATTRANADAAETAARIAADDAEAAARIAADAAEAAARAAADDAEATTRSNADAAETAARIAAMAAETTARVAADNAETAARIAADAAVALSAKPAAIVARTLADLPDPVGGVITLPPGVTLLVGDVPLGPTQPPAFLAFGVQIDVPPGSTLASVAASGCLLIGSHPAGLVRASGGSLENLIIANSGGPDVVHLAGTENTLRFLYLVGGGVRFSASNSQIELVSCTSVAYALNGQYIGINLINCNAVNVNNLTNWTGFDVQATASVQTGILWAGGLLRGGFDPAGARGIVVDPNAGVASWSITGCTFSGFAGVGSSPLVGLSADTTPTMLAAGCLGIANSEPRIEVTLDAISAGAPPATAVASAGTWYPLNCSGATVALASLMDSPTPGTLRMLWAFPRRKRLIANLTLDRVGGGTVAVSVRWSFSINNGGTWTPSAVQSMELKTTASPISITTSLELPPMTLARVEVTSPTAGLVVQTRAVGLSAA